MKAFLIITLIFDGVIKYGESVCWYHAFFDCAVGYSEFYVVQINALDSVQIQFNQGIKYRSIQTLDSLDQRSLDGLDLIVPIFGEF